MFLYKLGAYMKVLLSIFIIVLILAHPEIKAENKDDVLAVGYFKKFEYWSPVKQNKLSRNAQIIQRDLNKKHGAIIYSYIIDKNGRSKNIKLLQAIPEGFITTIKLIRSNLIYKKFKSSESNPEHIPVIVTERLVFQNGGIAIPKDEMIISDYLQQYKDTN